MSQEQAFIDEAAQSLHKAATADAAVLLDGLDPIAWLATPSNRTLAESAINCGFQLGLQTAAEALIGKERAAFLLEEAREKALQQSFKDIAESIGNIFGAKVSDGPSFQSYGDPFLSSFLDNDTTKPTRPSWLNDESTGI